MACLKKCHSWPPVSFFPLCSGCSPPLCTSCGKEHRQPNSHAAQCRQHAQTPQVSQGFRSFCKNYADISILLNHCICNVLENGAHLHASADCHCIVLQPGISLPHGVRCRQEGHQAGQGKPVCYTNPLRCTVETPDIKWEKKRHIPDTTNHINTERLWFTFAPLEQSKSKNGLFWVRVREANPQQINMFSYSWIIWGSITAFVQTWKEKRTLKYQIGYLMPIKESFFLPDKVFTYLGACFP